MSALTILAEECELLNDSKYRSYITQVEKALKSFEYTSEWADLISALGKLNKVRFIVVVYSVKLSGILSLGRMKLRTYYSLPESNLSIIGSSCRY